MVQINFAQKTVNAKIVYYGPGMSGKTTNLEVVHQRAPDKNHGELTSISTDGDRTLFFDYMPLDLGTVAGMRTCFQIYTVPGQVYYNSTRKLVLQGTDGVVFVADSSAAMLEQNLESLRNLEENLQEYGKGLSTMPHVIQYNKRDLPDAMPVPELDRHLNPHGAPTFEAVASNGQGVFPTLKSLAAAVLKNIMQESNMGKGAQARPAAAQAAPAEQPGQVAAPQPAQPQPAAPVQQPVQQQPAQQQPMPIAAQAQPQAPAQQPGQFAQPAAAPAATQAPPQQQATPAAVMKPQPTQAKPKASPAGRAHSVPATKGREKSELAVPRSRRNGLLTFGFVVLAAGVGAVLAWTILKVL